MPCQSWKALGAGLAVLVLVATGIASAQTSRTLVEQGTAIFGVGTVTKVSSVVVSDTGDWYALVETDGPSLSDTAILLNGIPTLQEGDSLSDPTGSEVRRFDQYSANSTGGLGLLLVLRGVPTDSDAVVVYDTHLLGREGTICEAPEFSLGTKWVNFKTVAINDSNTVLCVGNVDDPAISTVVDPCAVLIVTDENGEVVSQNAVLKEGDYLPDTGRLVKAFGTTSFTLDLNSEGDYLIYLLTNDTTGSDENVYLSIDGTLTNVGREGTPAPVAGRTWGTFTTIRLDMNNRGEYVFGARLDGATDNQLLVKNGEKFRQTGDTVQATPQYQIKDFVQMPVMISDMSQVFWACTTTAPDVGWDQGIFMNETMLVQEGVTLINGLVIHRLYQTRTAFHVSPNGRFLAFLAIMPDGHHGAYMIDLGLVKPMESCSDNEGELSFVTGFPLLGGRVELEMAGGQATGVLPILFLSSTPVAGWPPCGFIGSAGELLIDIAPQSGNLLEFYVGPLWGGSPISFFLDIPDDNLLIGAEAFAQGLFWDIGDQLPEDNLRLTGGVQIVVAPD